MQLIPGSSKGYRCGAHKAVTHVRGACSEDEHEHVSRARSLWWAFFNSLLAVLYLLGTSSIAAANPFDDASAAYERGDYVQAMKLFRQLAAQGHQWAQRRLGLIYAEGKGVAQDYQEAVKWYRLAAAQGNQFAQINLGVMYTNGTGVRQDFVRAHMWFTLAAATLSGDSGDTAIKNRDRIASKLTAEQIATAQELARRCQESKLKNCD
jgi:TPR repeat protein